VTVLRLCGVPVVCHVMTDYMDSHQTFFSTFRFVQSYLQYVLITNN